MAGFDISPMVRSCQRWHHEHPQCLWESSVMRALVVQRPGGPEAMRLRQLPAPQPGPDQVVVAVEAVGVNPVDAGNRADPSWAGVSPPYVVGYELAGRIQAVGD